jgi:septal ring-binding cell division protein DamX
LQRDSNNDDNVEEGGSHPTTPQTTATRKEGNVSDNGDNEHVDERVRGPRRADTGDGRWWRSRGDSDNDDDVEEGRSHPTPLTTATRKLAARLRSAGI